MEVYIWIAIIGGILGGIIILCMNSSNAKKEEVAQNNFKKENNIRSELDYSFQNSAKDIRVRYLVDNENESIYVANTTEVLSRIPFQEITGCEIMTDSEVTGGVGRAIVGGIVAGGVGAIIGATTAKAKIRSYKIIIYRNNLHNPSNELVLIKTETSTKGTDYKYATEFAAKVNASIKAIISHQSQLKDNRPQIPQIERSTPPVQISANITSVPNYLPGFEPENIQNLLKSFFAEVDKNFPDKRIIWAEWNHERMDKAAGYLCKYLGYSRGKEFLETYGYTVIQ